MKTILILVRKEFLQIMRNRQMLPIMTILPIFQIILLSFAANYEVKNLNLAVLDRDMSQSSRQLTARFEGTGFFHLQPPVFSETEADNLLNKEKADLVLYIPAGFEKDLLSGNKGALQLQINTATGLETPRDDACDFLLPCPDVTFDRGCLSVLKVAIDRRLKRCEDQLVTTQRPKKRLAL